MARDSAKGLSRARDLSIASLTTETQQTPRIDTAKTQNAMDKSVEKHFRESAVINVSLCFKPTAAPISPHVFGLVLLLLYMAGVMLINN